jgi:hypothetical protein
MSASGCYGGGGVTSSQMAGLRRVRYVTLDASPSFRGCYATSSEGPCVKLGKGEGVTGSVTVKGGL